MKIFAFDAKKNGLNGLWGLPFVIAAVVYDTVTKKAKPFLAYLGPELVSDSWVKENVLPKLAGVEVTHSSYNDMLMAFSKFYLENKVGADVVSNMPIHVDSTLLKDMHDRSYIGDFDGPYPLYELAGMLKMIEEDPTSVDEYIKKYNLMLSMEGEKDLEPHHPLYDAAVAALTYAHLIDGTRRCIIRKQEW